jgi:hypothetical protein
MMYDLGILISAGGFSCPNCIETTNPKMLPKV